jgi:hypothetical protein
MENCFANSPCQRKKAIFPALQKPLDAVEQA